MPAGNLVEPYVIAIEATEKSSVSGFKLNATNRTTDDVITVIFDSLGRAVIDLAEYTTALTDGDVIEIKLSGKFEGMTTHTVSTTGAASGGVDITLTTTAVSTSLENVNL